MVSYLLLLIYREEKRQALREAAKSKAKTEAIRDAAKSKTKSENRGKKRKGQGKS